MRKSILVWALMLTMGISSAFANNETGVSEKVVTSFKKEFSNAQDVKWESVNDFAKATFTLNEQVMFAYYSAVGELVAVSRNISSRQLPIRLLSDVKRKYHEYWITDLFEMVSGGETSYYITVENADNTVVLKSSGSNGWTVYSKEKKEL